MTVTRDDFAGLQRTYCSLLDALRLGAVEWIVVDGGECSRSLQLMREDAQRYGVFHLRGPDAGIYDAMRKGVARASGELVHFLNGGDTLLHSGIYDDVWALYVKSGRPQIVKSHAIFVAGSVWWVRRARPTIPWIFHGVTCNQQAMFYARSIFQVTGLDTTYVVCGDYALEAACYRMGFRSVALNMPTVVFFVGGVSSRRQVLLSSEARRVQREILNIPRWVECMSGWLRSFNSRKVGRVIRSLP